MAFKEMVTANKQWLTVVLFVLLLLVGGIGTCVRNYIPPLNDPVPTPGPGPKPPPGPPPPAPTPNDVWQPLKPPTDNKVAGLELPPPITIPANKKFIIVAAKCNAPVKWLITAKSGLQVEALESRLTNSILIFTTNKPGDVIIVLAYSVDKGIPTETAVTAITLDGTGPPPPGPNPEPPPEPVAKLPSKLHVTFFFDFSKKTRAIADIVDNQALRSWLTAQGHKIHEVSVEDVAKFNLEGYIEDKTPPLLILQAQAENGIKEGAKIPDGVTQLYSVQGVKDAVLKATGKKE